MKIDIAAVLICILVLDMVPFDVISIYKMIMKQ